MTRDEQAIVVLGLLFLLLRAARGGQVTSKIYGADVAPGVDVIATPVLPSGDLWWGGIVDVRTVAIY